MSPAIPAAPPHGAHAEAAAAAAERRWTLVVAVIIALLVVMMVITGLHWAAMPPSRVETVDVRTLHVSGEFVSVLMFAGRFCATEHGAARFLTLQKVPEASPTLWERVGILSLTLPYLDKAGCRDVSGLFAWIPARRQTNGSIVIQ